MNPLEVGNVVVGFVAIEVDDHFVVMGIGQEDFSHEVANDEGFFVIVGRE